MSRTSEVALALAGFEAGVRGERPDPTERIPVYHEHWQRGNEARVAMIQEAVGEAEAMIDHRRVAVAPVNPASTTLTEAGCPFCDYKGPSPIIAEYHQEGVFIIEPLNPVTPNHVLVIPRRHVEHFANHLEVTGKVAMVAADYARGRWDTDFNLITSKGPAATQSVGHLHFHLIPRTEGDGLKLPWSPPASGNAAVAAALSQAMTDYEDEYGVSYDDVTDRELLPEWYREAHAAGVRASVER